MSEGVQFLASADEYAEVYKVVEAFRYVSAHLGEFSDEIIERVVGEDGTTRETVSLSNVNFIKAIINNYARISSNSAGSVYSSRPTEIEVAKALVNAKRLTGKENWKDALEEISNNPTILTESLQGYREKQQEEIENLKVNAKESAAVVKQSQKVNSNNKFKRFLGWTGRVATVLLTAGLAGGYVLGAFGLMGGFAGLASISTMPFATLALAGGVILYNAGKRLVGKVWKGLSNVISKANEVLKGDESVVGSSKHLKRARQLERENRRNRHVALAHENAISPRNAVAYGLLNDFGVDLESSLAVEDGSFSRTIAPEPIRDRASAAERTRGSRPERDIETPVFANTLDDEPAAVAEGAPSEPVREPEATPSDAPRAARTAEPRREAEITPSFAPSTPVAEPTREPETISEEDAPAKEPINSEDRTVEDFSYEFDKNLVDASMTPSSKVLDNITFGLAHGFKLVPKAEAEDELDDVAEIDDDLGVEPDNITSRDKKRDSDSEPSKDNTKESEPKKQTLMNRVLKKFRGGKDSVAQNAPENKTTSDTFEYEYDKNLVDASMTPSSKVLDNITFGLAHGFKLVPKAEAEAELGDVAELEGKNVADNNVEGQMTISDIDGQMSISDIEQKPIEKEVPSKDNTKESEPKNKTLLDKALELFKDVDVPVDENAVDNNVEGQMSISDVEQELIEKEMQEFYAKINAMKKVEKELRKAKRATKKNNIDTREELSSETKKAIDEEIARIEAENKKADAKDKDDALIDEMKKAKKSSKKSKSAEKEELSSETKKAIDEEIARIEASQSPERNAAKAALKKRFDDAVALTRSRNGDIPDDLSPELYDKVKKDWAKTGAAIRKHNKKLKDNQAVEASEVDKEDKKVEKKPTKTSTKSKAAASQSSKIEKDIKTTSSSKKTKKNVAKNLDEKAKETIQENKENNNERGKDMEFTKNKPEFDVEATNNIPSGRKEQPKGDYLDQLIAEVDRIDELERSAKETQSEILENQITIDDVEKELAEREKQQANVAELSSETKKLVDEEVRRVGLDSDDKKKTRDGLKQRFDTAVVMSQSKSGNIPNDLSPELYDKVKKDWAKTGAAIRKHNKELKDKDVTELEPEV